MLMVMSMFIHVYCEVSQFHNHADKLHLLLGYKEHLKYIYVSLRLRVQNAGPAEPCVGKY